jgi:hypothetical protein
MTKRRFGRSELLTPASGQIRWRRPRMILLHTGRAMEEFPVELQLAGLFKKGFEIVARRTIPWEDLFPFDYYYEFR